MSYEAHVTDTAYCYDGSFAGFLCCVFESYARKEIPAEVCPPEDGQLNFFGTRQIFTDEQHAWRVAAGLDRLGREVKDRVTTGFLCTDPGKDLTLLRFVRLCFAQGPRADAGRPGRRRGVCLGAGCRQRDLQADRVHPL